MANSYRPKRPNDRDPPPKICIPSKKKNVSNYTDSPSKMATEHQPACDPRRERQSNNNDRSPASTHSSSRGDREQPRKRPTSSSPQGQPPLKRYATGAQDASATPRSPNMPDSRKSSISSASIASMRQHGPDRLLNTHRTPTVIHDEIEEINKTATLRRPQLNAAARGRSSPLQQRHSLTNIIALENETALGDPKANPVLALLLSYGQAASQLAVHQVYHSLAEADLRQAVNEYEATKNEHNSFPVTREQKERARTVTQQASDIAKSSLEKQTSAFGQVAKRLATLIGGQAQPQVVPEKFVSRDEFNDNVKSFDAQAAATKAQLDGKVPKMQLTRELTALEDKLNLKVMASEELSIKTINAVHKQAGKDIDALKESVMTTNTASKTAQDALIQTSVDGASEKLAGVEKTLLYLREDLTKCETEMTKFQQRVTKLAAKEMSSFTGQISRHAGSITRLENSLSSVAKTVDHMRDRMQETDARAPTTMPEFQIRGASSSPNIGTRQREDTTTPKVMAAVQQLKIDVQRFKSADTKKNADPDLVDDLRDRVAALEAAVTEEGTGTVVKRMKSFDRVVNNLQTKVENLPDLGSRIEEVRKELAELKQGKGSYLVNQAEEKTKGPLAARVAKLENVVAIKQSSAVGPRTSDEELTELKERIDDTEQRLDQHDRDALELNKDLGARNTAVEAFVKENFAALPSFLDLKQQVSELLQQAGGANGSETHAKIEEVRAQSSATAQELKERLDVLGQDISATKTRITDIAETKYNTDQLSQLGEHLNVLLQQHNADKTAVSLLAGSTKQLQTSVNELQEPAEAVHNRSRPLMTTVQSTPQPEQQSSFGRPVVNGMSNEDGSRLLNSNGNSIQASQLISQVAGIVMEGKAEMSKNIGAASRNLQRQLDDVRQGVDHTHRLIQHLDRRYNDLTTDHMVKAMVYQLQQMYPDLNNVSTSVADLRKRYIALESKVAGLASLDKSPAIYDALNVKMQKFDQSMRQLTQDVLAMQGKQQAQGNVVERHDHMLKEHGVSLERVDDLIERGTEQLRGHAEGIEGLDKMLSDTFTAKLKELNSKLNVLEKRRSDGLQQDAVKRRG